MILLRKTPNSQTLLLFMLVILCLCSVVGVFFFHSFLNPKPSEDDSIVVVKIELGKRVKSNKETPLRQFKKHVNDTGQERIYKKSRLKPNSNLNFFDRKRFDNEQNQDVQAPNTCIKSGLKPQFTICVYEMKDDIYVSYRILKSGIWEKEISELIKDMLLRYDPKEIVFLDVGANLGFHTLYAAKLGYNTWAVEPQQRNAIKIFRSALKSGIIDKVTIIQNAIAETRRNGVMKIDLKNNGGSFLELTSNQTLKIESKNSTFSKNVLQTVLLKDVFEAIKTHIVPTPLNVLMKIDIEHFECRAFLGSPEILRQNQNIKLLAVIMEWTFKDQNGTYSEQCPKAKVMSLTKLFLENGFTPFQLNEGVNRVVYGKEWIKLDTSNFGLDWNTNVLWVSTSFWISSIDEIKKLSFN